VDFLSNNPVFFRETRVHPRNRGLRFHCTLPLIVYPLIFILPYLLVSLICLISGNISSYLCHMQRILSGCFTVALVVQFVYIFYTSASTQTSLTKEKEMKTFEGLVASLMSPKEIVFGKLIVALYPALAAMLLFSPIFFGMGILAGMSIWGLFAVFVDSIGFMFFYGLLGLFASSISSKSRVAQTMAGHIMAFLILGTLAVDILIQMTLLYFSHGATFFPVLVFLNPVAGYVSAVLMSLNAARDLGLLGPFWGVNFLLMALMGFAFWRGALRNVKSMNDDDCSLAGIAERLIK